MAVITVSLRDLKKLTKGKLSEKELEYGLSMLGSPLDDKEGDDWKVEVFPNRPDSLCAEGLARRLRGFFSIETGLAQYKISPSGKKIKGSSKIRPFISACIVRDVVLSDDAVKQLMQLQEKLHLTHGRRRKKVAVGVHDLDKIKGPIKYKDLDKDKVKFVPLQENKEFTAKEYLEKGAKGKKFSHLVPGKNVPVLIDDDGVFSMPPIINGRKTQVTPSTNSLLIEATGSDKRAVEKIIVIIATALSERGAEIEIVDVNGKASPDFLPEKWEIDKDYCNKLLGLSLSREDIEKCLLRMRHGVADDGKIIVPSYRTNVMHMVDLVEDVGIAYDYSNYKAEIPKFSLSGKEHPLSLKAERLRALMTGFGFNEAATFVLTNPKKHFEIMQDKERKLVKIENPCSEEFTRVRDRMLPSLLQVLSDNTHNEYPQKLFEVGAVTKPSKAPESADTIWNIAGVISKKDASFSEMKGILFSLFREMDEKLEVENSEHDYFLKGRCGNLKGKNGFFGEIRPEILSSLGILNPAVGFEFEIEKVN